MTNETKNKPLLTVDVAEFEHLLAECDGTDAEKREYLETLWNIICEFVQLGWSIHPIQQAMNEDNTAENAEKPTLLDAAMVSSLSQRNKKPKITGGASAPSRQEGVRS